MVWTMDIHNSNYGCPQIITETFSIIFFAKQYRKPLAEDGPRRHRAELEGQCHMESQLRGFWTL